MKTKEVHVIAHVIYTSNKSDATTQDVAQPKDIFKIQKYKSIEEQNTKV